jgi:hypothetical protein
MSSKIGALRSLLSMRSLALAPLAPVVAGCSIFMAATADAPSDMRPLEPGSMRFAVEAVLGEPKAEEYNRATYEFSRGNFFAPGESQGLMGRAGRGLVIGLASATHLFIMEPLSGAIGAMESTGRYGLITIVYGPDGRVIGRPYEAAQALYVAWESQRRPEERLDLLCRAANAGYPAAKYAEAIRYQIGLFATPVNLGKAYLWARLAGFGGASRAAPLRSRLSAGLDPAAGPSLTRGSRGGRPNPAPSPQPPSSNHGICSPRSP